MLSAQINFTTDGLRFTRTCPPELALECAREIEDREKVRIGSVAIYDYRREETELVAIWYGEGCAYYGPRVKA